MDLSDILGKLTEDERSTVMAAIESEKATGRMSYKKKQDEVNRLLDKLKPIEAALSELGLETDGDDLAQKLTQWKDGNAKTLTDAEKQIKRLEAQMRDLSERAAAKEAAEAKYKNTKLADDLRRSIGNKIHASDHVIKNLIADGKVRLDESDKAVWIDDGVEVDFSKGVERFLRDNPEIVKNTQSPGAGGKPSGTQNNSDRKFTALEMLRMER